MNNASLILFPIVTLLFYLVPIIFAVFVVWFLLKFLKVQQEKNRILKDISDKLDKISEN
ncbi:hypothetical protein J5Y03_11700 [Bacillus sp. RG28]|uniref:Uncharacterized protein n=1 Tax=Gottfriedia endophytica TaxID=2820819 RepID=A0A940NPA8_9BACI|nr:hypothetical protein [Gottfriedia endophytica]MBP0725834.1 hypothetical protein [Gottfriedia endophytica]